MAVQQSYTQLTNSSSVKTVTTPTGPVDNLSNVFAGKSALGWLSESVSSTVDNISQSAMDLKSSIGSGLVNVGNSIKTSVQQAESKVEDFFTGSSDIGKNIAETRNPTAKDTHPNTVVNNTKANLSDIEYPVEENTHKYKMIFHVFQYQRPNPLLVAKKQQKYSITLPLPRELIDIVSVDIHEKNLEPLVGALTNEITTNRVFGDITKDRRADDKSTSAAGYTMLAAYQGLSAMPFGDLVIPAAEQVLGAIPNPHPSMMFSGVRLRNHTFSWRFSPTSSNEAAVLTSLIKRLKATSLPKFSSGDVNILQYPLMVLPEFIPDNLQNKLYKFKNCLIESVNVQYAAHGMPSFFVDGQPQVVEITVSLKEIEYLLADDYDEAVSNANDGITGGFVDASNKLTSDVINRINPFSKSSETK